MLTFFLSGCTNKNPFTAIDYQSIDSIIVSDPYIISEDGVYCTGIGIDTAKYITTDKLFIEELFTSYLNTAKEENNVKISFLYNLSFTYKEELFEVEIGNNIISFKGIKYKTNKNIKSYLATELDIIRRVK